MVTHDDVCDSCGAVGRTCRMRWPDGETREMCGPCERQWQLIWRHFCEFQPRQANRVRAQANRANRARPDGGEPLTDGGQPLDGTERPGRFSHPRNLLVDGPKGPMLAHDCESSGTGWPKPGSVEKCLHCTVDTATNQEGSR